MKKSHAFKTKLDSGEHVQLTITFDFTGVSSDQILEWALSNRVIAFQRQLRKLTKDEALKLNGQTIHAANAGRKIESPMEKVRQLIAAGIPEQLAKLAIQRPDLLNQIQVPTETETDEGDEIE